MHPHVGKKFLIEGSKLNLQGQGASKRKRYAKKGSLIEMIIPSSGMQPPVRLWRDSVLSCKVVITSTNTLPHILRAFLMVKTLTLSTLSDDLKCIVNDMGAFEKPINPK